MCAKLLTPAHRKGKDGAGGESDGACSAIGVLFQDCGTQFRIWRIISSLRNKTQDLFRDWHIIVNGKIKMYKKGKIKMYSFS